jgi:hypothetical protein
MILIHCRQSVFPIFKNIWATRGLCYDQNHYFLAILANFLRKNCVFLINQCYDRYVCLNRCNLMSNSPIFRRKYFYSLYIDPWNMTTLLDESIHTHIACFIQSLANLSCVYTKCVLPGIYF